MNEDDREVLIHICCAPCASASVERLVREGWQTVMFFSNSNIWPEEEYIKRLSQAERLASILGVSLFVDSWDHEAWLAAVAGYEIEPEGGGRCERCFEFSLRRTMKKAGDLRIGRFTTSLTISPHKNSGIIFSIGNRISSVQAGMEFLALDFKKKEGFKRSIELSREFDLYRQNYCGCEFSKKNTAP